MPRRYEGSPDFIAEEPRVNWENIEKRFLKLSPRHLEIFELAAKAKTYEEIASILKLDARTIQINIKDIKNILGFANFKGNFRSLLTQIWYRFKLNSKLNLEEDTLP